MLIFYIRFFVTPCSCTTKQLRPVELCHIQYSESLLLLYSEQAHLDFVPFLQMKHFPSMNTFVSV